MNVCRFGAFCRTACMSSTMSRNFSTSNQNMKIPTSTTFKLYGKNITETIGVVKGTTVARTDLENDMIYKIKTARQNAFDWMIYEAEKEGADAIVGVVNIDTVVQSNSAMFGAHNSCSGVIITFYGTAVKTTKE